MKNNIDGKDLFLIAHIFILILLVTSPLFLSTKFVNKYGKYISYFMVFVVFLWIIFGKCPLGNIENTDSNGSFVKFLKKILKLNISGFEKQINYITGIIYTYVMIFYSKYNINVIYYAIFYNIYNALILM